MAARIRIPAPLNGRAFSTHEALRNGVSPDRLRGHDLSRPFHGIRSADEVTGITARCLAYQQRMPPHAFFCSVTAAIVMGAPLPWWCESAPDLHVAVPAPQRALRGAGIVGHKLTIERARIAEFEGVRVSHPDDTWCQLGSVLPVPDLVAVGDFLVQWRQPLTTIASLRQAIDRHPGRRGKPALKAAVDLLNSRAESPQESRLRVILIEGGLDGFVVNLPIRTSGGHRYRADLAFPAQRVILEYQGSDHLRPDRYRRDMTRISRLEADGWYVIQVNAEDLRNPGELLRRIRHVLLSRTNIS